MAIYELNGVYGSIRREGDSLIFVAVLPDGRMQETKVATLPRYAGKTWGDVWSPPLRDPFDLQAWKTFIQECVSRVYDDWQAEWEEHLIEKLPYRDPGPSLPPLDYKWLRILQRQVIAYLIESDWAKSRWAQEQAIQYCGTVPEHADVVLIHLKLYQTNSITNYHRHRVATFIYLAHKLVMDDVVLRVKEGRHGSVRKKSHQHRGE